jgi:acyl-CoA dehydrogenase
MSEIRETLADTAARLFDDLSDRNTVAKAEAGEWPQALWTALEVSGLAAASAPDSGADLGDLAVILRETGSHASPVPLAETLAATWLLASAGLAVPTGPLSVATDTSLELRQLGTGWQLSGELRRVPWGAAAKAVAVVVEYEKRPFVVLILRGDVKVAPGRNVAGEPRDNLTVSGATLDGNRVVPSPLGLEVLRSRLFTFRLVEIGGALSEMLELTLSYANERQQFGKPIGKFQAIQQQVAVLASDVAAAAAAVSAAVAGAEKGPAAFEIAAASIRVCDAISQSASIAHQVHGAMGVTHEHPLHFYTRRLWAWRDEIGDEFCNARAIGMAAAKAGGQGLWSLLTDPNLDGAAK